MPGPIGWIRAMVAAAAAAVVAVVRKAGTPTPVPPDERERRALAAEHGPAGHYGLGAGGRDPRAPLPWGAYQGRKGEDPDRVARRTALGAVWLDCSGWIAWLLGIPRKIAGYARGYGWLSTDGIIADANDPAVELVRWAAVGEVVAPWCALVVYGSTDTDGDGDRDTIGHVGIVCAVPDGWTYQGSASLEQLTICHCAASASPTGAIRRSSGRPWRIHGRLVVIV